MKRSKKKSRRGNCYVTAEAIYHLLGGKAKGWVPHTVRHEGDVHWYLVRKVEVAEAYNSTPYNMIFDVTKSQFKTPPPYHKGRGRGFLTKEPSKRARAMMKTMVWQEI